MDLSAYILEDLHPGDRVELTCARTGTCEGQVLALDGTMLLLRTRRGRRRLALDTIESYEVLETEEPPAPPEPQEPEPPEKQDWEKELESCSSVHQRFRLLALRGDELRQARRYGEALRCYAQWQELYESELQTLGGQEMEPYTAALNTVKLKTACCYYFLGQREKAEALAHKLRRINAADRTVRAILRGELKEDSALTVPEQEKRPHPVRETIGGGDDGNMRLFGPYALECIRRTELGEVLGRRRQDRLVRSGRFCGGPQEAAGAVRGLLTDREGSRKQRSENQLAAARIIHQTWESRDNTWREDPDKDPALGCEQMYLCAGRGILTYGEHLMFAPAVVLTGEGLVQADSVRFHCLEAMDLVLNRRELLTGEGEALCTAALSRYVQTFFYDRERMQALIRADEDREPPALPDLCGLLSDSGSVPLCEDELDWGLIQLGRVLLKERPIPCGQVHSRLNELLEGLEPSGRREHLAQRLERMGSPAGEDTASLLNALEEVCVKSGQQEQKLADLLSDTAQHPLGGLGQSERLRRLGEEDWSLWMTGSDQARLRQGICLLTRLDAEGDIGDFERRDDLISTVSEQLVQLAGEIAQWPTRISFYILRPVLVQVRERLALEQKRLYARAPRITIRESCELRPYLVSQEKNVVAIHLNVKNAPGVQMADDLRLEVREPPGIRYVESREARIRGLRGGEKREICIRFRMPPGINSFHTTVGCRYCYKRDTRNIAEGQMERPMELTVVVPQKTEPIENIFDELSSSEMRDEGLFKGRGPLIDKLVGAMRTGSGSFNYGHCFALYGQTRAGKSSILYHLRNRVEKEFGDGVLVLDLGNISDVYSSEGKSGEFQRALINRIVSKLRRLKNTRERLFKKNHARDVLMDDLEARLERLGYTLESWKSDTDGMELQTQKEHFEELMGELDSVLEDPEDGRPRMLFLLIDEFSVIHTAVLNGKLDPDFMAQWKAFLQNHKVFAVVAGQDDMPQFIRGRKNQNAFMAMQLEKVSYLDERAAKELCSEPLVLPDGRPRYVDSALDAMYHLTAGSPYLILKLSAGLVDYMNRRGAARITDAILEGFLMESVFCGGSILSDSADFSAQLQDRSDIAPRREQDNRLVLTAVALASRRGGRAERGELERACRDELEPQRLDDVLSRLVERDVLLCQRETSGCYYHIVVELLARWLLYMSGNGER